MILISFVQNVLTDTCVPQEFLHILKQVISKFCPFRGGNFVDIFHHITYSWSECFRITRTLRNCFFSTSCIMINLVWSKFKLCNSDVLHVHKSLRVSVQGSASTASSSWLIKGALGRPTACSDQVGFVNWGGVCDSWELAYVGQHDLKIKALIIIHLCYQWDPLVV